MHNGILRAFGVQVGLATTAAVVTYLVTNSGLSAVAALYGGAVALLNAALLARRLASAGRAAQDSAQRGMLTLYLGALERFLTTLVGLGVGMGVLGLDPLPMVAAFAVTHLGYPFAGQRPAGSET